MPQLGAISLLRGGLLPRQRQLPPAIDELPFHRAANMGHHIHMVTARRVFDGNEGEGDVREYRGEDIHPPRTPLLGSNRPQSDEGRRRSQRHWDDWG